MCYRSEYKHQSADGDSGYFGFALSEEDTHAVLCGEVSECIYDTEGDQKLIELAVAEPGSDFENTDFSGDRLREVLSLHDLLGAVPAWKAGEETACHFLNREWGVRFHHSRIRDQVNPLANATGVDIIGFEGEGEVRFVLGEVKTSRDPATPPTVADRRPGHLRKQLVDLAHNSRTLRLAVRYIGLKASDLPKDNPFRTDCRIALTGFIRKPQALLCGVLVRDTAPSALDVRAPYNDVKKQVGDNPLRMTALYLGVPMIEWSDLVKVRA